MATSMPAEFGKYTIIEQIGQGGFGTVYKAKDTTLERTVALKVLHPALLNDPVFVERFQAEARMAAQLEHPNIVRVYEVGEHEGRHYLAMEYVEGQSLAQLLEAQGRLTPQQALKVVRDVASGLEAAHRKQLIHRDIKPSNVLIRSDGTALVTDFGLAKAAEASLAASLTTSSQVLGTLRYMAPEQAEQKPVTHLADIYALGVVLYEMLTGRPPFIGDTAIQLIRAHADKRPPPPSEFNKAITPAVASVILRSLAKKPEERYPTAGKMARALEGAVTKGVGETQTPTWPGAPAEPARPTRGFRWEPVIAGALLLLLCGILAGALALFSGGLGLGSPPTPTAVALAPVGAGTDTPTSKPSPQPATTATAPPPTPTDTLTPEPTATHTPLPPTATPTPTETPDLPATATAEAQLVEAGVAATLAALPTATDTPTPPEPTATPADTETPEPMPTETPSPSPTSEPSDAAGEGELPPAYTITMESASTEAGKGRLAIQLLLGDGQPHAGHGFRVYRQKQDLAGNWVVDGSSIGYGKTDSTGVAAFSLESGSYILSADFTGYNWGDAFDKEGVASVPLEAGSTTTVKVQLGRLVVGFLYGDGTPIEGVRVKVYAQKQDLAGNWVTAGNSLDYGNTDNAGTVVFNLTPGHYILSADLTGYNWGDAYDVEGVANFAVPAGEVTTLIVKRGWLSLGFVDAGGSPIQGQRVYVYGQREDVGGNTIPWENSFIYGGTDNTGIVSFSLTPGLYAIKIGGEYTFDVPVEAGRTTFCDGAQCTVQ